VSLSKEIREQPEKLSEMICALFAPFQKPCPHHHASDCVAYCQDLKLC
jgi:hypothetical protein